MAAECRSFRFITVAKLWIYHIHLAHRRMFRGRCSTHMLHKNPVVGHVTSKRLPIRRGDKSGLSNKLETCDEPVDVAADSRQNVILLAA